MISSPGPLSCLDPGLSIQITRNCAVRKPSSESTSTACPIFSRKLPRSLKPPCKLSTTRQGSLSARPLRLTIKLARSLVTIRFDRRGSGARVVSIGLKPAASMPKRRKEGRRRGSEFLAYISQRWSGLTPKKPLFSEREILCSSISYIGLSRGVFGTSGGERSAATARL